METKDTTATLTIKGVSARNSGAYTVTAENEVGSDTAQFTIIVKGRISVVSFYASYSKFLSLIVLFSLILHFTNVSQFTAVFYVAPYL